jgi:hypothetical protein
MYIRVIGGDPYHEIRGMSQATAALGEKIAWTIFRVPLLSGKTLGENEGEVETCYVGDKKGRDGLWLDRGRLCRWVLAELEEGNRVGYAPFVSNA